MSDSSDVFDAACAMLSAASTPSKNISPEPELRIQSLLRLDVRTNSTPAFTASCSIASGTSTGSAIVRRPSSISVFTISAVMAISSSFAPSLSNTTSRSPFLLLRKPMSPLSLTSCVRASVALVITASQPQSESISYNIRSLAPSPNMTALYGFRRMTGRSAPLSSAAL
ncbi:hypothetical protein SDC9_141871 [bioreactor metagenome]|uniref:Uncharacterized protein n=1 Tax=bioreactor metagenome TaxID=1076179 RepID=A0A645E1L7_9ZZZZ